MTGLPLWARHRREQEEPPPAWFTFHIGRTASCHSESSPLQGSQHFTLLTHFFLYQRGWQMTKRKKKKNKHTDSSYTTDCLTAREENILRCLISTVGKAILTKPINPWASDGTDLILSAAAVRPPLCVLLLCSDTLHSDDDARLYFAPPRNTNSHSDAACSSLRSTVERERERDKLPQAERKLCNRWDRRLCPLWCCSLPIWLYIKQWFPAVVFSHCSISGQLFWTLQFYW